MALSVINDVLNNDAYANIALNEKIKSEHLTELDKKLVTQLVYGTISKKITLDWYTKPYVKKTKKWVKNLLAMTVYQIIYMDRIPTSAAVDEAVKIAKKQGDQRLSGFVNGVLRNFTRAELRSFDEISDSTEKLGIQYSMPAELTQKFVTQFGFEKTRQIFKSLEEPSRASLRVNTTLTDVETEFNKLSQEFDVEKSELSSTGIVAKSGHFADLLDFNDGLITIQDESSQLVARLLDPQKTDYVLDMCSAPGSKTTHLAALMENQGKIEAYDLYKHKVKLIEHNLKRLGVKNVHVQAGDSTKLIERYPPETFDRILLDAPCSGFGVLKRKPEIKYHDSSVMDGLIPLQALLLENAYNLLKNDGTMVYSTCTINKKENGMMIEHFIQKHPDMKVIEQRTILNYEYHTDGFYMCKMKKG